LQSFLLPYSGLVSKHTLHGDSYPLHTLSISLEQGIFIKMIGKDILAKYANKLAI